ncbi:MAG: ABC transporter permease [Bacteroidetes bacterium]|nr:MAG: ABC transporter permease [Bacteroidota bacterium]
MNFSLFTAKRITFNRTNKKKMSASVLNIAVSVVAVGIAVMIITVSVVTGFKHGVYKKIIGFQAHITIKNRDINETYETLPISKNQSFYPGITNINGINHIQIYATKPGIIKTKTEVQGIVLKGVASDYNWDFLKENLILGRLPDVSSAKKTNDILISEKTANLLGYNEGDKMDVYFIQNPPKARRFNICGIYKTGMDELDKMIAICDIRHIQKINNWSTDQISGFEIFIDDFVNPEEMTQKVQDEVASVISEDGSMLQVSNYLRDNTFIVQWLKLSDTNVAVILTLMIIVSVLSMIAALLTIILERTTMIGILKALGADNSKIISIFLYNGMFLILKGLIIGNVLGFIILVLQKYLKLIPLNPDLYYVNSVPVDLNFLNFLLLDIGTLIISVFVLILPALLVAKIHPAKTINFK